MASYSIVLNLGGNINERLSKVNRQLDVADKRAKSLQKSLIGINAMSKGINLKGIDSLMKKLTEADKHAKSLSKSLGLASVRGAINTAGRTLGFAPAVKEYTVTVSMAAESTGTLR